MLMHMDVDLLTESQTAPHMRQPPSRKGQIQRLLNGMLALRKANAEEDKANQCKMVRGDVLLFRDGGKRTIADQVSKHMVTGKGRWNIVARLEGLAKLSTHVMISEDALKERRRSVRGVGSLRQLTGLHAFMNAETVVPEKARVVFNGTNMGDVLGPVAFEKWIDSWKVTLEVKKQMYGDNIRPVGGRNPGDDGGSGDEQGDDMLAVAAQNAEDEDEDKNRPQFQQDILGKGRLKVEPAFWWALPPQYYKEVKHSYYGRRIIDASPGPGNFLIATWDETPPTPYIGICFSSAHQVELMEHSVDVYLVKMATEGHPLYNKDYANFNSENGGATPASAVIPEAKRTPAPKRRGRPASSSQAGVAFDSEADAEAAEAAAEAAGTPAVTPGAPGAAAPGSLDALLNTLTA